MLIIEPFSSGGFLSRLKRSWAEDSSLFSWADRGQWETVQTVNRQVRREGDWFRIGFEPVFVDYTKRGTWFIVITLVEVRIGVVWSLCGSLVVLTCPRGREGALLMSRAMPPTKACVVHRLRT